MKLPLQKSNPSLRVSHMDYGIHTVTRGLRVSHMDYGIHTVKRDDPWYQRTHRGPALNVNDLSAT